MPFSIAFLSRDLPSEHPNGVSVQVHLLANELCRQGNPVTVFTRDPKPRDALYQTVQDKDSSSRGRIFRLFRPAYFFAGQNYSSFDIIHAHGDNYLLRTSKPIVRTFYGSALWEAWYDHRPFYRARQAIFYPLEWLSHFRSSYSVGISVATQRAIPRIQKIIPCGVDPVLFHSNGAKTPSPTILFVGNLSGRKRGWQLIDIFHKKIHSLSCSARLLLVTPEKVPHTPCIETYRVVSQGQLADLFRKSWILCVTSTYEGFGVPVIEAMASGTAVIATDNMGVREVLQHKKNGIICELPRVGDWINRLIQDHDLRKRLVQEGSRKAQDYSIQKIAEQYMEVYEQLISR